MIVADISVILVGIHMSGRKLCSINVSRYKLTFLFCCLIKSIFMSPAIMHVDFLSSLFNCISRESMK